jgi:sulfhydrogenase subunit beta (sulfur reductase)
MTLGDRAVLDEPGLGRLFDALHSRGYETVGPRVRDGAIVYEDLASASDLPKGIGDEQHAGHYRLTSRTDAARFGFVVGPHSWRRLLHPPTLTLWRGQRDKDKGFEFGPDEGPAPRMAFIGVRACELAAIAVQDRVLLGGPQTDPAYRARRDATFIVAVNCGQAGGSCFCASLGTGPAVSDGFDLALTEILDGEHRFLVQAGSERGAELCGGLGTRSATTADLAAAQASVDAARLAMGRHLDPLGIKELAYRHYESPRWDAVGERCLGCANCTLVCPTCFCTSVDDVTELGGQATERRRRWDSCFSLDFSYIHGGSVRTSAGARYRQWFTHKLATWQDQFGSLGCVGCGRCITWCPVGIDITEEAAALRREDAGRR